MFVGHHAVGFASKRLAPGVSLGWLMAAPLFLDLLWPLLVLAGAERVRIDPGNTAVTPLAFDHYPWSHSLVASLLWGLLFGGVVFVATRSRVAAVVSAFGVVSHWLLDALSHRPDMPVGLSGPLVGLGLWRSIPATAAVEGALFAVAIAIYARATRPVDGPGRWGFVAYVALVATIWAAGLGGPPPPSARAVAFVGLAGWLLPLWAAWFDRHRSPRPERA